MASMVATRCDTVAAMDADPALVATLRGLEEHLLRPDVRRSRAALEALLDPDFVEIGRSGRIYDRKGIVAALAVEDASPTALRITDFAVRLLAPGVALATYRTVHDGAAGAAAGAATTGATTAATTATTLRSSTWHLDSLGVWRMVFHQGTPAG
jgi:hypothetical protein